MNDYPPTEYKTTTELLSRYGKVKLKKGQRMYFHIHAVQYWNIDLEIK